MFQTMDCYSAIDIGGMTHIIVAAGAENIVTDTLSRYGYSPVVVDLKPPSEILIEKMTLDKRRAIQALGGDPRDWQLELFDKMQNLRTGQIHTSTGSGKSTAIAAFMYGTPKARKLYTTPGKEALLGAYHVCAEFVPDAVLVKRVVDLEIPSRAYFCTTGMLHHAVTMRKVFDYVFVDEHQMVCTNRLIAPLIAIKTHKIFAFSANYNDRQDGADKWSEVAFGPKIMEVSYEENVKANNVVRIQVRWRDTSHIGDLGLKTSYQRKFKGIVYNHARNRLICEDAYRHDKDQVLIMVDTVEHALVLRKMLRCPVAHAPVKPERRDELVELGLVEPNELMLDVKGLHGLTAMFKRGTVRLAIATGVWKQAIDFRQLSVLIRAEAKASKIASLQIVGRTSRICDGKELGIIYDYTDEFDENMKRSAKERKANYAKEKFEQIDYYEGHEAT